jgi:nicotinamidase-related amidase
MTTALLVIDFQMEMARRIAAGMGHANPEAGARIADLLALFRARGLPVIHIQHHNPDPASRFHKDAPTALIQPCAAPAPGEALFVKSGSSAFAGTGLEPHLRGAGIDRLVVCGAVAAFCVTSTVRAARDLGFRVLLAEDAVLGFDQRDPQGGRLAADVVMAVTLATLHPEFAEVLRVADVAGRLQAA